MASTRISSLIVKLTGDTSGLLTPLANLSKELQEAGRKANSFFAGFGAVGANLRNVGASLTAGISLPLAGVGIEALKASAKIETTKAAFETLTGSGDKAAKLLGQIRDFANQTPFEFPDLARGAQRLLGFGFEARKVEGSLRSVGEAVSAVGGGAFEMDRIILALGQIQAKGKLSTEELNQLAETGLPVRNLLAEGFKITQAQLVQLTEKGLVPAKAAIDVLLAGFNKNFAGSLGKQAETLTGIFSTLKDQVGDSLRKLGDALAPTAKRFATDFAAPILEKISELVTEFEKLPQSTKDVAAAFGGLAIATPVAVFALGQLALSITSILTVMKQLSEISLVQAAGGITSTLGLFTILGTAALAGYLQFKDSVDRIRVEVDKAEKAGQDLKLTVDDVKKELAGLNQEGRPAVFKFDLKLPVSVQLPKKQTTETNSAAAEIAGALDKLNKTASSVTEVKLPEWLTNVSANARDALRALNGTNDSLQNSDTTVRNIVLEEVAQRNAAAFKTMQAAVVDFLQASQPFGKKLQQDAAAVDDLAVATTQSELALAVMNDTFRKVDLTAGLAQLGVEKFKTSLEDFGLRTSASVRKEIEQLSLVIDELFAKRSAAEGQLANDINNDLNKALEKRKQLEGEIGGSVEASARRQSRALVEVSTVVTNLSQGIANSLFEMKGFGTTTVKILEDVGKAITANLIQNLLKAGLGLAPIKDGLGKLGKIPGLGKIFGLGSDAAGAAGSAASAGSSVASSGSAALASSGLASTISAVSGVVSAVTGVIGVIQGATTNKRLGQIEVTGRGQLNQAIAQQETFNLYLPSLPQIVGLLKQVITYGLGVFSYPQSVIKSYIVGSEINLGGDFTALTGALAPLPEMLDRLNQIIQVGIPVYNASFQPALRVETAAPMAAATSGVNLQAVFERTVIAGGPYQDATLDWITDQIALRLQARGVR